MIQLFLCSRPINKLDFKKVNVSFVLCERIWFENINICAYLADINTAYWVSIFLCRRFDRSDVRSNENWYLEEWASV